MKLLKLFCIIFVCILLVGCSHEHNFIEDTIAPTCTEDGYTSYYCGCGYSYTGDVINKLGHSYGEWNTVKEATEEESGIKERFCTVCFYNEREDIPIKEHVHEYNETIIEPTCVQKGYTQYTCECGYSYNDNEINPTGHEEVIIEAKEPTCNELGNTAGKKCGKCEEIIIPTKEIPFLECEYKDNECINCHSTIGLTYTIVNNLYVKVSGTNCVQENVTIASKYKGLPVREIASSAFKNSKTLKTIFIPSGITTIGWYAFRECNKLTTVYLPQTIEEIVSDAFKNCNNIIDTYYQGTIENWIKSRFHSHIINSISGFSSKNYYFLNENNEYYLPVDIVIPGSIKEIGWGAFEEFTSIENVIISEGVEKIGVCAFASCTNLKTVEIPNSVVSIGASAFSGCTLLQNVKITSNITSIGASAFSGCHSITSVFIPSTIKIIDESVFSDCRALSDVTIEEGIEEIRLSAFRNCIVLKKIVIPEGVEKLGEKVFCDCKYLKEIVLPATLKEIGTSAFAYTEYLKTVYYNGTVENWLNITFGDSDSNPMIHLGDFYILQENNEYGRLYEVIVPSTIKKINHSTFEGFKDLQKVTIEEGVEIIEYNAFNKCENLEYISIPNSIKNIDCFFWTSEKLKYTVESGLYYLGNSDNKYVLLCDVDESITECKINDETKVIASSAFYGCKKLKNIIIPSKVEYIGRGAFSECIELENIEISDSVTHISYYAFMGCFNLKSIIIPRTVKTIQENAFVSTSLTIYCEIESQPEEWEQNWNYNNQVVWGYK